MHLILLSGGSGKRLWPLSNDIRSKQFLKFLRSPDGTRESMLQRVYRQLMEIGGWESITIVASAAQKEQIMLQLGDKVFFVAEPERRDTFPAILLACAYLHSEQSLDSSAVIGVLPVDSFVEINFFNQIKNLEMLLEKGFGDLALVGVPPLEPSEKFGYIIPEESRVCNQKYIKVKQFIEKPDKKRAQDLIQKGAVWNCGVFAMKLGYLFNTFQDKDISYQSVLSSFNELEKTSFDYKVVEKSNNISLTIYDGIWQDLGTWESFTEQIEEQKIGNVILDKSCQRTHIINELELPVIGVGLTDLVVVSSPDGILIADKEKTVKLKAIIPLEPKRPMFEERRWGSYWVLDYTTYAGHESLTKRLQLKKGKQISYQYHNCRKEIWTIVSGEGLVLIEGDLRSVKYGDVLIISEKQKHGIKAITELEIIEVQIGKPLSEEDIIRLDLAW